MSREQRITQQFHVRLLYQWRDPHEIQYARPKKLWENKALFPQQWIRATEICIISVLTHELHKAGPYWKAQVDGETWISERRPTWFKTGLSKWNLLQCQIMFGGKVSPRLARVPDRHLEAIRARWWDLWQHRAPSEATFGTSMKGLSSCQPAQPPCRAVGVLSWAPGNQLSWSPAAPACRTSALTYNRSSLCLHI